jgi:hypothetical protein
MPNPLSWWLRVGFAAALAVALAGCGGPAGTGVPGPASSTTPGTTPGTSSASPSSIDAARAELDRALEYLEDVHPEPFHAIGRNAFVAELDALKARLPELAPEAAAAELMRTWALLAAERDGHQFALPLDLDGEPILPIRVYEFAEGVFVTAALPPHEDLVGARIIAVGETPIAGVLDALEPLVPRDGPATVASFRPMYLLRPIVLRGLGIVGDGPVPLTVSDAAGERTVELDPVASSEHAAWAGWLALHGLAPRDGLRHTQHDAPHFGVELLDRDRAVYVRFAQVRPVSSAAIEELRAAAAGAGVERVVVDLRQNTGGDNTTYPPLLGALVDIDAERPGRLVVLTDRVTFSAAANFATRLEQETSAVFAGEPMGGGLNFWNDVDWVNLEGFVVPMRLAVSTRYWEMSTPDDPRLSIEPDLAMPVRAVDYFAGRDPLLEAVLAGEVG